MTNKKLRTAEQRAQKRSVGKSDAGKFRITLECVQEVHGYFDESVVPTGRIAMSCLVLHGSHARLSNISDEETWLVDEAFVFSGKETLRKQVRAREEF